MLKRPSDALPAALLILLAGSCGGGSDAVSERVVLITLDTLRYDALPGIDAGKPSMPNTWAWAQDAVIFERYYSATSTTQPSHATMFTGLHPWQSGVSHNGALLPQTHATVAERLSDAGWRTAAAVASFPVHSTFGFDQGFGLYREIFNSGETKSWSGHEVEAEGGFFATSDLILGESLDLLDNLGGSKQFFWFHFFDAHAPYGDRVKGYGDLTPSSLLDRINIAGQPVEAVLQAARGAYDKDVRKMDRDLQRLFERLEQDGIPTHVIIVSDHGESFGEGASLGHGKRLTPEQIHVPLLIKSPRLEPGTVSEAVGTIDITATILGLAGLEGAPKTSRDLTSTAPWPERVVIGMRRTYTKYTESRVDGTQHRITDKDNKFFIVEDGVLYTGNQQLVSRNDDEQALADAELTARYKGLFDVWEKELSGMAIEEIMDPEALATMRALGYIDDEGGDEH